MKNINKYIFIGVLAFLPLVSADATLNAYKSDNTTGPANAEVLDPSSIPTEDERSKMKDIDTSDAGNVVADPEL